MKTKDEIEGQLAYYNMLEARGYKNLEAAIRALEWVLEDEEVSK
jgi:hypothetical protein